MLYLALVSLVWAFSFGLIKRYLGGVHPAFVAWARMTIALPLFLPFLKLKKLPPRLALHLAVLGAVQYGLMYVSYLWAFRYLDAYLVALFTIFTPLYVGLIAALFSRRFRAIWLASAVLAVAGAAVVIYRGGAGEGGWKGFFLMQISNLCFAFGQVEYKRIRPRFAALADREVYALLYLGAAAVTAAGTSLLGGWVSPASLGGEQVLVIIYLGVLASGLCFFWWNLGAVIVNPGRLAVFNNVKIPLAVAAAVIVFGETAHWPGLLAGAGVMAAGIWLAREKNRDREYV